MSLLLINVSVLELYYHLAGDSHITPFGVKSHDISEVTFLIGGYLKALEKGACLLTDV
jgi:hypothetical protein